MFAVILTLLSRLGCFQLLTNDANLLFCILDHIRAKELSFPGFRPVKRRSTFSSIENFERSFAQASLITVVISELGEWEALLPIHTERDDRSSEHILQNLIDSFYLTA